MKLFQKLSKNKQTATEKPNDSASTPPNDPLAISASRLRNSWKKVNKRWIIVVVVLVAGGGAAVITANRNSNVVFMIDGKSYSKAQVEKLTSYPRDKGEKDANKLAKTAYDALLTIKTAEKLGIKPKPEDITLFKNNLLAGIDQKDDFKKKYDPWFDLVAEKDAVEGYVMSGTSTGFKGYNFVFYFGQHLNYGASYSPPGLNDPTLVAQDKEFAESTAKSYHEQLKTGKIKPEDALKAIQSEQRFQIDPGRSSHFGAKDPIAWKDDIFYDSLANYVEKLTQPGLTDIQTGNITLSSEQKPTDVYYYFVLLEEVGKPAVSKDKFDTELHKIKADYRGVKK